MANYIGNTPECVFKKQASEGLIPRPPYNEQGVCARGIPLSNKRMLCCSPAISSMLRLELTHVLLPGDTRRVINKAPRNNTMRQEAFTILNRETRRERDAQRQKEQQRERSRRGRIKSRKSREGRERGKRRR